MLYLKHLLADGDKMRSWFIHNFFAHPLMAMCNVFGFSSVGERIHNRTLPHEDEKKSCST